MSGKYAGGMRIVEGLQHGIHLAEVFNDIARDKTPLGVEMYVGALENLAEQFLSIRNAGFPTTHRDKQVNEFLRRPPYALAAELTRLFNGGDATTEQFQKVVPAMISIVWERRLNFTRKDGTRLAFK